MTNICTQHRFRATSSENDRGRRRASIVHHLTKMEAWKREMEEAMVKRLQEEEGNSDGTAPRRSGGWGCQTYASFLLVFFIFFWAADLSTDGVVSFLVSKPKERRSLRGAVDVHVASNYTTPGHLLNKSAIGGDFLQRSHGAPVVSSGVLATAVGVHAFKPKEGGRLGGAMKGLSMSSDATFAHELNRTAPDGTFLQGTGREDDLIRGGAVHITFAPERYVWELHYFDKEQDVQYTPQNPDVDNPNNPNDHLFELRPFSAIHSTRDDLPFMEFVADDREADALVKFTELKSWLLHPPRVYRYATLENACLSFESAHIFAGRRAFRGGEQTPINWPRNTARKLPWFPLGERARLPNVISVEPTPGNTGAGSAKTFAFYRGHYEGQSFILGKRLRFWVTGFTWKTAGTPCKHGVRREAGFCEKFEVRGGPTKVHHEEAPNPNAREHSWEPLRASVEEVSVWPPTITRKQNPPIDVNVDPGEAGNVYVSPVAVPMNEALGFPQ
ncbi:unnamed protein product [Amoebophrya sp. A25]|nr:unnamed protein product [Amoebophrya sp. A25]|eukprot:GSA25T00015079001.1